MDHNSTVTLTGKLLLVNQVELVTSTTIAGTLYGIAFTLFCLYIHSLVPRIRDDDRARQAKFMLVYSIIIMLCGLYYLVLNAWVVQDANLKHGSYPGGAFLYVFTTYHAPATIIGFVCQWAINVLTSGIQIWRVWVIWSATRYAAFVIVLPSLFFLAFAALNLRTLILNSTLSFAAIVQKDVKTNRAEIVIQGITTILCTTLISVFLVVEQWRQRRLIGESQRSAEYTKIAAMLIESYALESIWLLILAIIFFLPVAGFFSESNTYIEIIAYLLVQYRVASGRAYESQRGQSNIGSLHWNRSNHVTTQFGETNEAGDDRHMSEKPGGVDSVDVLPVSTMA